MLAAVELMSLGSLCLSLPAGLCTAAWTEYGHWIFVYGFAFRTQGFKPFGFMIDAIT